MKLYFAHFCSSCMNEYNDMNISLLLGGHFSFLLEIFAIRNYTDGNILVYFLVYICKNLHRVYIEEEKCWVVEYLNALLYCIRSNGFQSGHSNACCHQHVWGFFLHCVLTNRETFSPTLVGVKWDLIVILICISIRTSFHHTWIQGTKMRTQSDVSEIFFQTG